MNGASSGMAMRLAVWIALLAMVLVGRWLWSQRADWLATAADDHGANSVNSVNGVGGEAAPLAARHVPGVAVRVAQGDEWDLDIATLGRRAMGKRLIWRPLYDGALQPLAQGLLVWWHDGQGERLGYAPHPAENADEAIVALMRGLLSGQAVLYNAHGDGELGARIGEGISANWRLPQGLTILQPPQVAAAPDAAPSPTVP